MPECVCDAEFRNHHHYVGWVYTYFSDCVYSVQDQAAFYIGMSSLAFWICCQAPQFIKNWRSGTAEALSILFLLEWLGGDILNLAGCILTNQLPTQTYTAILFVSMDAIMMTQYVFLQYCRPKAPAKAAVESEDTALLADAPAPKPTAGFTALTDASTPDRSAARAPAGSPDGRGRSASAMGTLASPPTVPRGGADAKAGATAPPPGSLELDTPHTTGVRGGSSLSSGGSAPPIGATATVGIAVLSLVAVLAVVAPMPTLMRTHGPVHSAVDLASGPGSYLRVQSSLASLLPAWGGVEVGADGIPFHPLPRSLRGGEVGQSPALPPLNATEEVVWHGGRRLDLDPCKSNVTLPAAAKTTGVVMGYLSSVLYLNSRLPQIIKNCQRRSVAGLSWLMFFCAFMGNVTTVTAIFMRISSKADWEAEAPFLPGNAGTLVFDLTIMIQYFYYTRRASARHAKRQAWKEALGSTAEEVMGSGSLSSDSDGEGATRARGEEEAVALLLAGTPVLPANARRGVHDIVETVDAKYLHAPLPTPPMPPKGDAAQVRAAAAGWAKAHGM